MLKINLCSYILLGDDMDNSYENTKHEVKIIDRDLIYLSLIGQ